MAKSAHVKIEVFQKGWGEAADVLEKLPIAVRGIELEKAIMKGLGLVVKRAKQLVPPPGYPGDKKDKKPLRDTITTVKRRYHGGAVIAGVVGPEYPAGAHGHLVEHGHRIAVYGTGTLQPSPGSKRKTPPKSKIGRSGQGVVGGQVPPHEFMEPAYQDVKSQIEPLIISALQKAVTKHGG